jgi:hypothetical protein
MREWEYWGKVNSVGAIRFRCDLCNGVIFSDVWGLIEHVRLFHDNDDNVPLKWPDGGLVVHEEWDELT